MKKYKILIIVILAGALSGWSGVKNASAVVEESGKKWYSPDETESIELEIKKTAEESCGDDGECRKNVYVGLAARGGIYQAANLMSGRTFMVTKINPEKSSITFEFNGRLQYNFRKLDDMQTYPSEVSIGWVEEGKEWSVKQGSQLIKSFEGGNKYFHVVYQEKSEDGSQIIPIDTEITVANSRWNLSENTSGRLYYHVRMTNGTGESGYFDYKNCLSRDGYWGGGECQIMTNGTYLDYFPIKKEVVEVEKKVIVEVEKEVVVEVEKEIEVEKEVIVEVPVEKIVEKVTEVKVPVEVEKRVEVPFEVVKFVEMPIELTRTIEVEKTVEKEVAVEVEKVVEREVPVEVEKVVEKEVFVGMSNPGGRMALILAIIVGLDVVILWWFWPEKHNKYDER